MHIFPYFDFSKSTDVCCLTAIFFRISPDPNLTYIPISSVKITFFQSSIVQRIYSLANLNSVPCVQAKAMDVYAQFDDLGRLIWEHWESYSKWTGKCKFCWYHQEVLGSSLDCSCYIKLNVFLFQSVSLGGLLDRRAENPSGSNWHRFHTFCAVRIWRDT